MHWEFMFTRPVLGTAGIARQQDILRQLARLVDQGKVVSTRPGRWVRSTRTTCALAHALLESGRAIGKIVLAGWP